jgi:hypothetical protein
VYDAPPTTAPTTKRATTAERAIRCARCGHALTSTRHAIDVAGRHAHVFMNPSGVVFPIRCFAEAPGVNERGAPTREATWFPGTAWTYAHCAGCGGQVGWRYVVVDGDADVDAAGDRFHGLIADAVVDE